MKKICVTGANGFIGQSICRYLTKLGIFVRGAVRSLNSNSNITNYECVSVGDISNDPDWSKAISGCECIIHSAGIADRINDFNSESEKAFQKVNVDATKKLANQAFDAGVKRLIFLSSVKVNGERTEKTFQTKNLINRYKIAFSHKDDPLPEDDYAKSKLEAERYFIRYFFKDRLRNCYITVTVSLWLWCERKFSKINKYHSDGYSITI